MLFFYVKVFIFTGEMQIEKSFLTIFVMKMNQIFKLKTLMMMNTKRILFGLMTCAVLSLTAVSCTPNTADDNTYEQGVDKSKVRKSNKNN